MCGVGHWTLDDIPWERFDAAAVDPGMVAVVKAAAMVEFNGADYASYLCNVFAGDDEFCAAARRTFSTNLRDHNEAVRIHQKEYWRRRWREERREAQP